MKIHHPVPNDFHFVNAGVSGMLITDTPLNMPAIPQPEEQKSFNGTISDFRHNNDGMVNGIVLGGKQIVDLPPHRCRAITGPVENR